MTLRQLAFVAGAREGIRALAPEPRRKVRAALDELARSPELGEPLERELTGLRRLRVGRLRLIYRQIGSAIQVVAVGPRTTIYAELERNARSKERAG